MSFIRARTNASELGGPSGGHEKAVPFQAGAHFGYLQHADDLGAEPVDRLLRRRRRREHAHAAGHVEIGNARFDHRRDVLQEIGARARRDRERPQLAGRDVLHDRRCGRDEDASRARRARPSSRARRPGKATGFMSISRGSSEARPKDAGPCRSRSSNRRARRDASARCATSSLMLFAGSDGCTRTRTAATRARRPRRNPCEESYGSFERSTAFDMNVKPAMSTVWPSAGARATASVPMIVFAPGRFSTSTVWPERLAQRLRHRARHDVVRSAGRERHDETHDFRRKLLRDRIAGERECHRQRQDCC